MDDKKQIEEMAKDKISILCIEDGSVDLDELENGLQDGKILTYRQGAIPPYVITMEVKQEPYIDKDSVVLTREEYDRELKRKYQEGCSNTSKFFYELQIPNARKETAIEIYRELQGHGTTYVKKWIKKQFEIEVE